MDDERWKDRHGVVRYWDKLMHEMNLNAPLAAPDRGWLHGDPRVDISNRVPLDPDAD